MVAERSWNVYQPRQICSILEAVGWEFQGFTPNDVKGMIRGTLYSLRHCSTQNAAHKTHTSPEGFLHQNDQIWGELIKLENFGQLLSTNLWGDGSRCVLEWIAFRHPRVIPIFSYSIQFSIVNWADYAFEAKNELPFSISCTSEVELSTENNVEGIVYFQKVKSSSTVSETRRSFHFSNTVDFGHVTIS